MVLWASLGVLKERSRLRCKHSSPWFLQHRSLDHPIFGDKKKSREKGGEALTQSGGLDFLLYSAVATLITGSAALANWESKIVDWQICLLKRRQMEKQPEKNELHSKRSMSAWKRSNTLKTERLQKGDAGLNGTGKKKNSSKNVFKLRCKS